MQLTWSRSNGLVGILIISLVKYVKRKIVVTST